MDTGWPADLTWYKLLTDWGSVIAGTVGFAAAIVAVLLTLRSEQRRGTRQLKSLRRALGVEVVITRGMPIELTCSQKL